MIFISHATPEDNEVARWLALRLAAEGYPVWCDLTKLLGGEPFWAEIEKAIRERTCKFLFLASTHSHAKPGTMNELAVADTVKKQLKDDRFIIPVRVDDMDFANANILIHKLNIVDFSSSWIVGLKKLIDCFQEDNVATDSRFSKDAVSIWWRNNFAINEGVTAVEEPYLSNEFSVQMPQGIRVISLQNQPLAEITPDDSPYPVVAHKRFLVSFAEPRDLLPFIEKHKLDFDQGERAFPLKEFLECGIPPAIEPRVARNLVRHLFLQAVERFATSRGLCSYTLATQRKYFWFPHGLLEGDKLSFKAKDGQHVRRSLVGFSTRTKSDGSQITQNWHFGIQIIPSFGKKQFVSVLPHVCFSEDGVPYDSKKQHRLRRSRCRSWYNDEWRDRILAAMRHLAGDKDELTIPVSSSTNFSIAAFPEVLMSPVSYVRVHDAAIDEEPPESDTDFEEDEIEEDDDE